MTPERWQQAKEIFHSALERPSGERSAFLAEACRGDEALGKEVESLLAAHEKDGSFIDSPAYEAAAELIVNEKAELKPGQTVCSYEIISFISRGGMGEVYLGQDKRLGRRVALKLLPALVTKDVSRIRRFEQEARAASALNHPNIITIYEIHEANSTLMIATEFVEGETLRQRLASGALSFNEALHVAIQIADALSAAHKAGIIHRDIKPENVMIRPDGYVKVPDFGLAKLTEHTSPVLAAEAPTKKVKTGSGMIMGTVGYMSPEQARGQAVDARSDIFNLGAVIYEMVAGQKPFDGETPSDILAAILKTEPPLLSHFAPEAPPELVRIVTKALRKDREQRYQAIKEMLLDLKSLKEELEFQAKLDRSVAPSKTGETSGAVTHTQPLAMKETPAGTDEIKAAVSTITHSLSTEIKRHKAGAILAVAVLLMATAVGILALYNFVKQGRPLTPASTKQPQVLKTSQVTAWSGLDVFPSFSPDGNSIAYSSDHNGTFEIYIKQLAAGGREMQLTTDGQQNFQPAWSPDGKLIAYQSKSRGIWIVPAFGGVASQLTDFGSYPNWSPDGTLITFQSGGVGGLTQTGSSALSPSTIWTVPFAGGSPQQITQVGKPDGGHGSPSWSPDGKRIAFATSVGNRGEIWSVSARGDELKMMHRQGNLNFNPVYSPDGETLYFSGGGAEGWALWGLHVSPQTGEPLGDAVPIKDTGADGNNLTELTTDPATHNTDPSWFPDGQRIAYRAEQMMRMINLQTGRDQLLFQLDQTIAWAKLSPDGKQFAFNSTKSGTINLWTIPVEGGEPKQLTFDPDLMGFPSWSPDGRFIAFEMKRGTDTHIAIMARGGGKIVQLTSDPGQSFPNTWSPDGSKVAFAGERKGIWNIWWVSVKDKTEKQVTNYNKPNAYVRYPAWSALGNQIVYEYSETTGNIWLMELK